MEREMTEMYDRQQELVSPPRVVHVVGCGGVGTWAAIMLALSGVKHLHLYEDDVIDESNLNRLPYAPSQIGQTKMDALCDAVKKLRPEIELTQHGRFQPLMHRFQAGEPVIGAVDTMRDRQVIYGACRNQGAYYIDIGAESHQCTLSDSPADWMLVADRPGYFTPIWVAPAVMAAALAVSAAVYRSVKEGDSVLIDLTNLPSTGQGRER